MSNLLFTEEGWEDYLYWQKTDKAIVKKINELLKDISRNGLSEGIEKPEPLNYRKEWSRRITQEHRLIYHLDEKGSIVIVSLRGHYED